MSTTSRNKEIPKAESFVARKKIPVAVQEDDEQTSATSSKAPTLSSTTPKVPSTTTNSNLERRTGLASPQRLRDNRPNRPEEQHWRYNPTPKPKVAIQGTSGGSASHFRDCPLQSTARQLDVNYDSGSNTFAEQDIPDPTEIITLRVQSVTPEGYSNLYYEVATIKSPYIMRLGADRNARYVTLTRSYTRLITPTPPPTQEPTADP